MPRKPIKIMSPSTAMMSKPIKKAGGKRGGKSGKKC